MLTLGVLLDMTRAQPAWQQRVNKQELSCSGPPVLVKEGAKERGGKGERGRVRADNKAHIEFLFVTVPGH